jgi:glycosyltransferase involved in cell wall biosynthesis
MNILFTRFPLESRHGGAEVQVLSLMRGLKDRGHSITFLGSCPILLEETAHEGIPVQRLDIGPPPVTKWGAISFHWRRWRMRRSLKAALLSWKQTIDGDATVIMLSLSEKLLLTPFARALGMRVLWIEHDSVGFWLRWNPWLPLLRKLSRHVMTVCVSELSRSVYCSMGWHAANVITIPNGVTLPKQRREVLKDRSEDFYMHIGCVARLHREKGIDLLMKAASRFPNVRLTVVGVGPEEDELRHQIAASDARDRIAIIPTVEDLSDFYNTLDLFILPSRTNDPFGMVVAEAMVRGVPVIVTEQCGIAGYLQHDVDALIAVADSARAIADAIVAITDRSVRARIAAAGKVKARKLFSVDAMVDSYEKALR